MKNMKTVILTVLILMLFPLSNAFAASIPYSSTTSYTLNYTVDFQPDSEPFIGGELSGDFELYRKNLFTPTASYTLLGSSSISNVIGEDLTDDHPISFTFDLDPSVTNDLYIRFGGAVSNSQDYSAYALGGFVMTEDLSEPVYFPTWTSAVIDPVSAPYVEICAICNTVISDFSLLYTSQLFAFASPGQQVGTLTVQFASVPEPSTYLLLGSGLVGLVYMRRRFKKKHLDNGAHQSPSV